MELNTQAIDNQLSGEELKDVKAYFETNKAGILKELEEPDHHISLRPLAVVFREPKEALQRNYHSVIFSENTKEDGIGEVNVELVR